MRPVILALIANSLFSSAALSAQDNSATTSQDDVGEILVVGMREGYALDARTLRRIGEAWRKYRAFAPQAPLKFRISDTSGRASLPHLWLEKDDAQIDIPVAVDGTIALPEAAFAPDARLHVDRHRGAIMIRPEILTPGTTQRERRLGDLRLQCRLLWAIKSGAAPVAVKAYFALGGGLCASRRIEIFMQAPVPVSSASVAGPAGVRPVPVRSGNRFWPPVHDRTLSNEAVINLQ